MGAASLTLVGLVAAPGVSQAKAAKPAPPYYLSLGDSYSVGYQPNTNGIGGTATAGYTAYVAKKEKMQLENFGCGGATTLSLLTALGCTASGYGPVAAATDAVPYSGITQDPGRTQLHQHPGQRRRGGPGHGVHRRQRRDQLRQRRQFHRHPHLHRGRRRRPSPPTSRPWCPSCTPH